MAKEKHDAAKAEWNKVKPKKRKKTKEAEEVVRQESEKHPLEIAFESAKEAWDDAKAAAAQKDFINLWHDPAADCPSSDEFGSWMESKAYWNCVRNRVVIILRELNKQPTTPNPF